MYLVLSILSSSIINLVFKYLDRYQVDNQQAITINYWTCVFTGLFTSGSINQLHPGIYQHAWAQYTLILGLAFVTVFTGMAVTAQKFGISVSVIASKMGVAFPVIYAFLFLKEDMTWLLIAGILLSFVSIFFVSRKKGTVSHSQSLLSYLWLPLFVFIGSGLIDTSLKVIETQLGDFHASVPTVLIFLSAAVIGSTVMIYRLLSGKSQLTLKNVLGGIALGIPNYFSIYFLIRSLQSNNFVTAQIYPLNNIGIVVVSTVLSILIFRERMSKGNLVGIGLALLAILLISWPF